MREAFGVETLIAKLHPSAFERGPLQLAQPDVEESEGTPRARSLLECWLEVGSLSAASSEKGEE